MQIQLYLPGVFTLFFYRRPIEVKTLKWNCNLLNSLLISHALFLSGANASSSAVVTTVCIRHISYTLISALVMNNYHIQKRLEISIRWTCFERNIKWQTLTLLIHAFISIKSAFTSEQPSTLSSLLSMWAEIEDYSNWVQLAILCYGKQIKQ